MRGTEPTTRHEFVEFSAVFCRRIPLLISVTSNSKIGTLVDLIFEQTHVHATDLEIPRFRRCVKKQKGRFKSLKFRGYLLLSQFHSKFRNANIFGKNWRYTWRGQLVLEFYVEKPFRQLFIGKPEIFFFFIWFLLPIFHVSSPASFELWQCQS